MPKGLSHADLTVVSCHYRNDSLFDNTVSSTSLAWKRYSETITEGIRNPSALLDYRNWRRAVALNQDFSNAQAVEPSPSVTAVCIYIHLLIILT
jgi:hypothetical protein